jgi:hypothetical protein
MRQGVLFRIRYVVVSIAVLLFLHNSADALWLDISGTSYPEPAQLFVILDEAPPKGDEQHGLFAMPPNYRDPNPFAAPRLAIQYRADFPLSVTFVTDGAIGGDTVAPTGAFNFTTRVIFMNAWWSPTVTGNFADLSLESMAAGRLEVGQSTVRSEWKIMF